MLLIFRRLWKTLKIAKIRRKTSLLARIVFSWPVFLSEYQTISIKRRRWLPMGLQKKYQATAKLKDISFCQAHVP